MHFLPLPAAVQLWTDPRSSGSRCSHSADHRGARRSFRALARSNRMGPQRAVGQTCQSTSHCAVLIVTTYSREMQLQQTDAEGLFSLEVLQSQLMILKVLSIAMGSRWTEGTRSPSRASTPQGGSPAPDSPIPQPGIPNKRGKTHTDSASPVAQWIDPPQPLDDNCAKYILSVMVLFLRQSGPNDSSPILPIRSVENTLYELEQVDVNRSTFAFESQSPGQTSIFSDPLVPVLRSRQSANSISSSKPSISSIPIPPGSFKYERTHMSFVSDVSVINKLITKFAGRIIYHLSTSNWKIVFSRLRNKIHFLASGVEGTPDTADLAIMSHCALDRLRLIQVLNGQSRGIFSINQTRL